MRTPRFLLLTLLLLSAGCRAIVGAAEIEGPDSVPAHQLATVTTSVEADGYIWLAFPLETTFSADQADPRRLQFTGTPGAHQVILIPLRDGKVSGQYRKTVVFGEASPAPLPVPVPVPVPPGPPVPKGEVSHATLIYDGERLATARPDVRTGMAKLEGAGSLGVAWHAYEDDQEAAKAGRWMDHVQRAGGLPALILQARDGTVIGAYPCPPTVGGVLQLIDAASVKGAR